MADPYRTFARLVGTLLQAQKGDPLWLALDAVPPLLRWLESRPPRFEWMMGGERLLGIEVVAERKLVLEIDAVRRWALLLGGLEAVGEIFELGSPVLLAPVQIVDAFRPVIHDLAQLVADEGWEVVVKLAGEPFLRLGAPYAGKPDRGFGPARVELPVLSRFLAGASVHG
jgi:hypothetical protein